MSYFELLLISWWKLFEYSSFLFRQLSETTYLFFKFFLSIARSVFAPFLLSFEIYRLVEKFAAVFDGEKLPAVLDGEKFFMDF